MPTKFHIFRRKKAAFTTGRNILEKSKQKPLKINDSLVSACHEIIIA